VRDEAGRPIQTKIVRLKGIASEEDAGQLTATRDEQPESPPSRVDGS
jgi:hypothetical protein